MTDMQYDATDPVSIEKHARKLVGHTIREMTGDGGLLGKETVRSSKGGFGIVLERLYFRINPPNDEGVPDFKVARVELKSSPTYHRGNHLVAKERMVLSIINYMNLVNEKWADSTFLKKNKDLLLVFYLHKDSTAVVDLKVVLAGRWTFPPEDLLIIKSDWEKIKEKVHKGKAHELSEGDTLYLRACTKDSCAIARKEQPSSDVLAKQRAFSLKPSYVNSIIERMQERDRARELANVIIKDAEELKRSTFEQVVEERFRPYLNRTVDEIAQELGINYSQNVKNYNDLVTRQILGVKDKVLEFERADVAIKSVLLDANGGLKESISFPYFDPVELAKETDWDTSSVRELFERRFFFVVYQRRPDGMKELSRVLFWSMPNQDLLEVKKVWGKTIAQIKNGRYDDLPKISDNRVSHIRPHGRNAQDKVRAPDGSMVTKKCFWLNAKYVAEQVGAGAWVDHKQSKLPLMEKGSLTIGEE